MGNRLIFYDTSNFIDYPVGGQLTSIRNFLHFLKENFQEHSEDILLVGVTTDPEKVGKLSFVSLDGIKYPFLAVTQATVNLGEVKKSLRLEYMKGIWKYRKVIRIQKKDCNYIHTPEEIRERYRDQIVMDEDIPEIISGAMGDHMWTARLDTEEQKDEFIDFVQATWQ